GEGLAVEAFEHEQVRALVALGDLEELADVGALDGAGDLGFTLEAADEVWLHGRAGEEDLDGDLAFGLVADGGPDFAHPAPTQQARYSVACKNVARVDRHVTWIGTVPQTREISADLFRSGRGYYRRICHRLGVATFYERA